MAETPRRILIVDDDEFLCRTVGAYLEDIGYRTLQANNGVDGLEMLRAESPDLALVDLRMPGLSGQALLEIARREMPRIPLVMISGTGEIRDVVEVLRAGAWDFVVKPVADMDILRHVIDKAFERRDLLDDQAAHRQHLTEEIARQTAELRQANEALERKNLAMQEVIASVDAQRQEISRSIQANIEKVVLPMLHQLAARLDGRGGRQVEQVVESLREVTSPFTDRLAREVDELTPTELRLCQMIRRGMGVKEIAHVENVSPDTISTHRRNIRRKLGLTGRKINLATYLDQLLQRAE